MLLAIIIRFIATILLIVLGVYPETGLWTSITIGLIALAIESHALIIRKTVI